MMGKNALGKVHVITGPGKGKTTAAFGFALRAAGHGYRVCIVQFMKSGMTTGEAVAVGKIQEIALFQFGTGRFADLKKPSEEDRRSAKKALEKAEQMLAGSRCDVLILDEVNVAAHVGLVDPDEILAMLKSRNPGVEVVLTGRDAPAEFTEFADYVSYVDSRKHPYLKGQKAREGVEW